MASVPNQDSKFNTRWLNVSNYLVGMLNDAKFRSCDSLPCPLRNGGMKLVKRLTLLARRGRIVHIFYRVFPPNENASHVSCISVPGFKKPARGARWTAIHRDSESRYMRGVHRTWNGPSRQENQATPHPGSLRPGAIQTSTRSSSQNLGGSQNYDLCPFTHPITELAIAIVKKRMPPSRKVRYDSGIFPPVGLVT